MSDKTPFGLTKQTEYIDGSPGAEVEGYDESQPGGICHYDGPEAALPVGGYSYMSGWGPELAAKLWIVASAEAESGMAEKRTKDLSTTDFIIGVELNTALLAEISKTYGPKFYLLREANGGPLMTATEWTSQFGTDGLALVAIRNMRQRLAGKRGMVNL